MHRLGWLVVALLVTGCAYDPYDPYLRPGTWNPTADNDANLRLTNLPPNLVTPGGLLYVCEIYSRHPLITPFNRFGVQVPGTLYSIAYF